MHLVGSIIKADQGECRYFFMRLNRAGVDGILQNHIGGIRYCDGLIVDN